MNPMKFNEQIFAMMPKVVVIAVRVPAYGGAILI
jgi:hypothetical protein